MQTAEQDAFVADIAAKPDDDLPRLVYADWLEEHGQADRAALIRVQCEVARTSDHIRWGDGEDDVADNPRYFMLREQEKTLLRSTDPEMYNLYHVACWPPSRFQFRRGFLELVRCETGDWVGEPCPNCHERGLADPETGIVECGRCDCTGEIGRMGPTILQDFPTVRRVELDDCEPAGDDDNGWYWFDESRNRTGYHSFHHLPEALYKRLVGGRVNGNVTLYDSREQAETALSDACIRFANEDPHGA